MSKMLFLCLAFVAFAGEGVLWAAMPNTTNAVAQAVVKVPEGWRAGPDESWFVDLDAAKKVAAREKKPLLVLNTGSDWCPWCVRLHDDVLKLPAFKKYAKKYLVCVYLDHPRGGLPDAQKAHNGAAARALGFGGGVPQTRIFAADGQTLLENIPGYRPLGDYISTVRAAVRKNAGKGATK